MEFKTNKAATEKQDTNTKKTDKMERERQNRWGLGMYFWIQAALNNR